MQDKSMFVGRPETVLQSDPNAAFFTGNQIRRLWGYTAPIGTKKGIPNPLKLTLKLYQSGGAEMPASSEIFFALESKSLEYPIFIGKVSYADFFRLTVTQQKNREFAAATIKQVADAYQRYIKLDEQATFAIYVRSSVNVDTASASNVIEYEQDNVN